MRRKRPLHIHRLPESIYLLPAVPSAEDQWLDSTDPEPERPRTWNIDDVAAEAARRWGPDGAAVVEALSAGPVTVRGLAELIGRPRSTTHELLRSVRAWLADLLWEEAA